MLQLVIVHSVVMSTQASVAFIKFFVCFGFVAIFLGLVLGGGGDRGGSFFSSMTIFSAARFFDSFLLLPSPSVVSSPHRQHVTYVRMCAGPDSFTSCSQINRDRECSLTSHSTQTGHFRNSLSRYFSALTTKFTRNYRENIFKTGALMFSFRLCAKCDPAGWLFLSECSTSLL